MKNGHLPPSWTITPFGKAVDNLDGQRVPLKLSDREQRSGEFRYYGASGVIDHVDDYLFEGDYLLVAEDGANLLARSTPIAFLASGKFWVNNHAHIVQSTGTVDLRFLQRYLCSIDIQRFVTGSAQPKLNQKNLNRIPIPLPPLSEQKRIADILDKADAVRRKRKEAIEELDTLLQSTFLDMLGDPVTNPKGWPVLELESLVSRGFQNGAYYPKEVYTDDGAGIEMVHMSDAFYGSIVFDKIRRVSAPDSDVEKYSLNHNDILVARRSLNYEGSAKPCRVPKNDRHLIFESSLIRVTTDRKKLHPLYLHYYLSNPRARSKYVFKHVTKSTISGINQAGLGRVEIVLPPIAEQHKFVSFHDQFDLSTARLMASLETLDNLFNSLVQRAFRGEL